MAPDTCLLNTRQYKVCIKANIEQSRENESAPPLYLCAVAIEKKTFASPTSVAYIFISFYVSLFITNNLCIHVF